MTLDEIYQYLSQAGDCWEWQHTRNERGYGLVWHRGATRTVHRVIYEHLRASVPDGLQLDHLCRNTACCNPWHLDPVTGSLNMLRAYRGIDRAADFTCKQGHPWTDENTYVRRNGKKECRACGRLRMRRLLIARAAT